MTKSKKIERCGQCAAKSKKINSYCGFFHGEEDYYVLDCADCGKTIVDKRGRCCAKNCTRDHEGRWWLTFSSPDVLLKVYDPETGQSLVGKDEDD